MVSVHDLDTDVINSVCQCGGKILCIRYKINGVPNTIIILAGTGITAVRIQNVTVGFGFGFGLSCHIPDDKA